jgi:hypothetical protein
MISVFLELRYVLGNLELSFFVQVEVLEKSPSNNHQKGRGEDFDYYRSL